MHRVACLYHLDECGNRHRMHWINNHKLIANNWTYQISRDAGLTDVWLRVRVCACVYASFVCLCAHTSVFSDDCLFGEQLRNSSLVLLDIDYPTETITETLSWILSTESFDQSSCSSIDMNRGEFDCIDSTQYDIVNFHRIRTGERGTGLGPKRKRKKEHKSS